jgi:hypothetical protein
MPEGGLRNRFNSYLGNAEIVIYSIIASLLLLTLAAAIASSGKLLWEQLVHRGSPPQPAGPYRVRR